jgi:hypothetical protein
MSNAPHALLADRRKDSAYRVRDQESPFGQRPYVIEVLGIVGLEGLEARIVHRKNSLGFRGPELPADYAERLSIIAVGGSTTECFYIPDGKTWPDLPADSLGGNFSGLWLDNAGLDGHSTWGHACRSGVSSAI